MWLFTKNILFTLLIPGSVAGYVPYLLIRDTALVSGPGLVPGTLAALTGLSGYCWCVWDFAVHGGGTPAPIDAPGKLVIGGLYRVTRNPMYVSVLLVIIAWSATFASLKVLLYGSVVAMLFHLFIIFYEEPHLTNLFGSSYRNYCSKTPRWLPWPGSIKDSY